MCVRVHTCHGAHVEVRRQLVRVSSLLPYMGPEDRTQVIRPGGKCLYLLTLISPRLLLSY